MKPYFVVVRDPHGCYCHKNIGAHQSWIVGPGQTCRWYKFKRDALKAAKQFNGE